MPVKFQSDTIIITSNLAASRFHEILDFIIMVDICNYHADVTVDWVWHDVVWRHRMETHSALLVLCEGNPPTTDKFFLQRASISKVALWCCLWCAPEQTVEQTVELLLILDDITVMMWRHCNGILHNMYIQTSNISRTLGGNKIVAHPDVVGVSLSAPPQLHLHSQLNTWLQWLDKDNCQTRRETLSFGIWCSWY